MLKTKTVFGLCGIAAALITLSLVMPGCKPRTESQPTVPGDNSEQASPADLSLFRKIDGKDAYDTFVASAPVAVVVFFAPWDSASQDFVKGIADFGNIFPDVKFAAVNIDTNKELSDDNDIDTLPLTQIFANGKLASFIAGNNPEGLKTAIPFIREAQESLEKPNEPEGKDLAKIDVTSDEDTNTVENSDFEAVSGMPGADGEIKKVSSDSTIDEVAGSSKYVVIDFNATWCGPCRKLGPYLERMANTYKNDGVSFFSCDVDECRAMATKAGVSGIPDVRIFADGKQVGNVVGYAPLDIIEAIDKALSNKASDQKDNSQKDNSIVKVVKPGDTLDDLVKSAKVVVIDQNATWCGPCRKLAPKLEEIAESLKDRDVVFFSCDVDECTDLSTKLGGNAIPDVRIYVNGFEFGKIVGYRPDEIEAKIHDALNAPEDFSGNPETSNAND